MAYASVPLYRLFCQATGYGGTPQRAEAAPREALARTLVVEFDANTGAGLPWTFSPVQRRIQVRIGQQSLGSLPGAQPFAHCPFPPRRYST